MSVWSVGHAGAGPLTVVLTGKITVPHVEAPFASLNFDLYTYAASKEARGRASVMSKCVTTQRAHEIQGSRSLSARASGRERTGMVDLQVPRPGGGRRVAELCRNILFPRFFK